MKRLLNAEVPAGPRFSHLLLSLSLLALAPQAHASAQIWTDKCAGCHGTTPSGGARANAADAPNVIQNAQSTVPEMQGLVLSGGDRNSLAAYIESVLDTTPTSVTINYDTDVTLNLSAKLALGTPATGFTAFVQDTAPTKGTVTYNTVTPSVTYNPNACATGADSFSYHLRTGPGGLLSSIRVVNVTINNNPPIPVITSATTHAGTFGTAIAPYTIASTAYPCPTTTTFNATGLPPGVTRSGAVLSGTPTAAGTYTVTLTATNSAGSDQHTLTFTVAKASQAISFPDPPSPRPFLTTPQSFPAATGGGSGIAIVYSSGSPSVCSVNTANRTYTMITAGTCTINANQAGNANYEAAAEVSRTVTINPTAPGAPTIGSATPGFQSASVSFTPPANTGGQALTYTASCSAPGQPTRTASGGGSPLTVTNLVADVAYLCSVSAANSQGSGGSSGSVTVTPMDANADTDGDGVPNGVEAGEGLNPQVKDNDVFANARLFAMQQYRDFLGREGDAGGIDFHTQNITSGASTRVSVIEQFLGSAEFQNGLPQCTRLYFSFFGRIPDYGGLLFQVGQFRSGVPLDQIAQNFANSPEFTNRYGTLTSRQYVTLVYRNVLGREPDPDGFDYYVTRLDNGQLTQGQVMIGFSESPEFQQIIGNEVYVTAVYVGMLRREPDPGGMDFYVDAIEGGQPRNAIITGFLNSSEYRARFLP